MAKHTSQPRLGLSPIGILGAGRVDPFLSYPVENPGRYLHEIVDLVVTYVIPGFIPDENSNQSSVNSVAKAWILAGLRTPLLFHALVFAGIIYYDFMRRSKIFFNSPLALSHKLIVIQKIRDTILAGGEEASRDEVLLAIVILATHDIANVAKEGKMPFNSPLKKAGWLNFYGKTHEVPEHAKAITDIIGLRGGIKSLKLPGLIEILAGRDLILAVNSISKPAIPLIIRESCITSTRAWAKSPLRMPSHISLASAFKRFADYGITDDMVEAFDSVGHITMAIDYYIQGMPGSLPLGRIIRTRTAVQKLVMLLPAAKELELNISASSMPSIYECCRLTAIIFGVAVIFPVSNSYDILQTLVQLLKAEIEISQIESTEECLDVFLWMLILGGIAALDKLERPWFVSQLVLLIERSKEKLYWIEVEHKLKGFLWLDIACGASARRVWNEVLNLVL
ncbi:hypothetical protein N431DRAFT_320644 [Stipitochalara longipes BDJ]|nr:hypothetical protein N431DRAFT_320644 [Stipitochalara longipes BDJ]